MASRLTSCASRPAWGLVARSSWVGKRVTASEELGRVGRVGRVRQLSPSSDTEGGWGELGELGEFASFPPGRGAAGGQPASQGPNELAPSRGNLANSPNPPNSPRGDAPETSGGG